MMHLITCRNWMGVRKQPGSNEYLTTTEHVAAYASSMPINDVLQHLKAYERAFAVEYPLTAIQLDMIGYAALPVDTDDDALRALGVLPVESLGADFENPEARAILDG